MPVRGVTIAKRAPNLVSGPVETGLRRARMELLAIPKPELSFQKLSAWQSSASAATNLAHATGIELHNPISRYIGALQGVSEIETLEAVRMQLANMITDVVGE